MKAKIKEKKEIAEGTLLVIFDLLGKEINFNPGQFFSLTLLNPFYTDEKGNQRYFSIVNCPEEKGILTIATRVSESAFKKSLLAAPIETEVDIGIINGNFVLPDDKSYPLVFIAGGIGITPFISMLRHVEKERLDYKITLIYSNRDQKSTSFLEELKKMTNDNPNLKLILTMTDDESWQDEKRRIDSQFIKDYFQRPNSCFYLVSGPPKMVEAISNSLSEVGVEQKNIKTDNFSGY